MRVVGGVHKGRRLITKKGVNIRPTLERVREAIFNVLTHGLMGSSQGLKDAIVIDLFCGTGALGIEALSRGAAHVTFLEQSEAVLALAKRNASLGGETAQRTTFLKLDATMLPRPPRTAGLPHHFAFLDPPYGEGLAPPALVSLKKQRWLAPGAIAVVEKGAEEDFRLPLGFRILDTRSYGVTQIIFLQFSG